MAQTTVKSLILLVLKGKYASVNVVIGCQTETQGGSKKEEKKQNLLPQEGKNQDIHGERLGL